MNARIRRRGGRYEVVLDVGEQDAQRCPACVRVDKLGRERHTLYWLSDERLEVCPECGGELETVTARREKLLSSHARQKDALAAKNKALTSAHHGELVDARRLTVGRHLRDWMAALDRRVADGELKPSTALSYKGHCTKHILPALEDLRLQELTTRHIDEFYKALAETEGRGGHPLSVATRRHIHVTLHAALKDAKRQRLVGFNPADDAEVPRTRRERIDTEQVWTAEQLRTFLTSVEGDRLGVLWLLMGTTGLRRAEALGLRRLDVDLDGARLRVQHTRTAVGYEIVEGSPKSAAGCREVPLLPETVAALRRWLAQQSAERLKWGAAWADTGLLFTREDGTGWHPDRITKLFAKAQATVRAAQQKEDPEAELLPQVRLHDLRHAFATFHIAAGTSPKHLQKLMGHSRIGVTLDTYVHPEYDDLVTAQDALGAFLSGRS